MRLDVQEEKVTGAEEVEELCILASLLPAGYHIVPCVNQAGKHCGCYKALTHRSTAQVCCKRHKTNPDLGHEEVYRLLQERGVGQATVVQQFPAKSPNNKGGMKLFDLAAVNKQGEAVFVEVNGWEHGLQRRVQENDSKKEKLAQQLGVLLCRLQANALGLNSRDCVERLDKVGL